MRSHDRSSYSHYKNLVYMIIWAQFKIGEPNVHLYVGEEIYATQNFTYRQAIGAVIIMLVRRC